MSIYKQKSVESARKQVKILGINVDVTPGGGVLIRVKEDISYNRKFYIVTPNPELVLMAQGDLELKNALNSSSYAIPDGIGLSQAAAFLSLSSPKNLVIRFFVTIFQGLYVFYATFFDRGFLRKNLEIIKGRDLFLDLISLADKNKWKVFFLGGENSEALIASKKLSLKYKKVIIKTEAGPKFNNNGEPDTDIDRESYLEIVKKINSFKPELLIVCLQDPKEEKFVYKNLKKLNIKGAAAFGGTFRYIAGMSKLPPKFMDNLGLEWLWRLMVEPYRFKRIINATIVFPFVVWKHKLFNS